jgi:hypothetical protein
MPLMKQYAPTMDRNDGNRQGILRGAHSNTILHGLGDGAGLVFMRITGTAWHIFEASSQGSVKERRGND